jgi:hypothetical protein
MTNRSPDSDSRVAAPSLGEVPDQPTRADHLQLLGELQGTGFQNSQWLVSRGDRFYQLTELPYRLLQEANGQRSLRSIASRVGVAMDRSISEDDVRHLVQTKLMPMGLIAADNGQHPPGAPDTRSRTTSALGLYLRVKVSGDRIDPIARRLQFFHLRAVMMPLLFVGLVAHVWLYAVHGVTGSLRAFIANPDLVLIALSVVVLAAVFHEFGHASALRYEGGRARAMGAGFYLAFPAFYTDVTDSYRLGRLARIRVDLGGPYFHAIFTLGLFALYLLTAKEHWLVLVLLLDIEIGRQFLPIGRLDGYWAMADLTGIPDFLSRLVPFLANLLPISLPESLRLPPLRPLPRRVFALYSVALLIGFPAVVIYLVSNLPGFLSIGWNTLLLQVEIVKASLEFGDLLTLVGASLQILFLALGAMASVVFLYLIALHPLRLVWGRSREQVPFMRRMTRGGVFVMLGGALGLFGCVYPWEALRAEALGLGRDFSGLSTLDGRVAFGCMIAAVLAGAAMWLGWQWRIRRVAAFIGLALGLLALGISIHRFTDVEAREDRWVRQKIEESTGAPLTPQQWKLVRQQIDALGFSIKTAYGPLLLGVGGLLALGGGLAGSAARVRPDTLAPASPSEGTDRKTRAHPSRNEVMDPEPAPAPGRERVTSAHPPGKLAADTRLR